MAEISAWLAVAAAAGIVFALAPYVGSFEFGATGPLLAAMLLGLGAWRTLTAKSGDMRLLCGAWGVAAGLAWYAPSYSFPDFLPGMLAVTGPVLVSAIGLALAVLHGKETV
jgi:hypothetical protein